MTKRSLLLFLISFSIVANLFAQHQGNGKTEKTRSERKIKIWKGKRNKDLLNHNEVALLKDSLEEYPQIEVLQNRLESLKKEHEKLKQVAKSKGANDALPDFTARVGELINTIDSLSLQIVYFEENSASLSNEAKEKLAEIAKKLKRTNKRVEVVGYADEWWPSEYSITLPEKRANEVKNFLLNIKVDSKKILLVGGTRRTTSTGEQGSIRRNRRVEIHFVE